MWIAHLLLICCARLLVLPDAHQQRVGVRHQVPPVHRQADQQLEVSTRMMPPASTARTVCDRGGVVSQHTFFTITLWGRGAEAQRLQAGRGRTGHLPLSTMGKLSPT